MSQITVPLWMLSQATVIHAYDATAGGYWTSTTVFEYAVPAGKKAWILGVVHDRDASATSMTEVTDGTNRIALLESNAAGTDQISWPSSQDQNVYASWFPLILEAGYTVTSSFGAAQGAGAYATIFLVVWDV